MTSKREIRNDSTITAVVDEISDGTRPITGGDKWEECNGIVHEAPPASALQDNIARKGKNSYYFAHAHKATGPQWDGKAEPRLLKKESSLDGASLIRKAPSFLYHKSNITSYAFVNEEKVVKLYISLEKVGDMCTKNDVSLDWNEESLSLVVKNYRDEDQCLSFGKLSGRISDASFRLKANKIILTLKKEKEGVEWHTINDKGARDHELS